MPRMILPAERDPRLITARRGGTLSDTDHHLLALWAAGCAERVAHHFDQVRPEDSRAREAIDVARAWVDGQMRMSEARKAAFASNAASATGLRRGKVRRPCRGASHSCCPRGSPRLGSGGLRDQSGPRSRTREAGSRGSRR
jgi:Imm-5 like putative immunity protein